jgi:hypothetical protein
VVWRPRSKKVDILWGQEFAAVKGPLVAIVQRKASLRQKHDLIARVDLRQRLISLSSSEAQTQPANQGSEALRQLDASEIDLSSHNPTALWLVRREDVRATAAES